MPRLTEKQLSELPHEILYDTGTVDMRRIGQAADTEPTDANKELRKAVRESLTRLFLAHWQRNELPELQAEYHFHSHRLWRFDYALPEQMIAVEVDGGTRQQGRHNRADGYAKDAVKINTAIGMGWRVFRFSDVMIKEGPDAMDFYLQPVKELLGGDK